MIDGFSIIIVGFSWWSANFPILFGAQKTTSGLLKPLDLPHTAPAMVLTGLNSTKWYITPYGSLNF